MDSHDRHNIKSEFTALIDQEMRHYAAPWKAGMVQQPMSQPDRKI